MTTFEKQKDFKDNKTNGEMPERKNFVREIIDDDLKTNKFGGKVHTRFPSRTERIPPYRTCKIDLPQFRTCERLQRIL